MKEVTPHCHYLGNLDKLGRRRVVDNVHTDIESGIDSAVAVCESVHATL